MSTTVNAPSGAGTGLRPARPDPAVAPVSPAPAGKPRRSSLYVRPAEPKRPRRSRVDLALSSGLTAVVLVVLSLNIAGFPAASDDEGTYLAQAWAVQHGKGLAHYTYWYDHPPLAWIQLAGLSWLPHAFAPDMLAVANGRIAMLPVIAISLMLVYHICRRLQFARWAAALALLVFGLSPLAVTMNRQIYLDSFAVVWMLAALALALSPRKHLWHFAAAGAATTAAVLSKETILVALPAVLVALWQNTSKSSTRPWAIGAYISGLVLVGIFYPLYAVLRGELFPGSGHVSLVGAWQFQLASRSGSGSVFSSGSGSAALLHSWLYYDGVILVAGLAAAFAALFVRRLRAPATGAAILALVAIRPGGYLPAMYVVQLLPFFAIVIAGVLEAGVAKLQPRRSWWRAGILSVATLVLLAVVVPRWYVGERRALTTDENAPYAAAANYLRTEVPNRAGTTVVVDDVLWLDCVNSGYTQSKVIWFYKLDLDPGVKLPLGWRSADYIVSTPALRQNPGALPTVLEMLTKSTAVATFGTSDARIEIRRVNKELG